MVVAVEEREEAGMEVGWVGAGAGTVVGEVTGEGGLGAGREAGTGEGPQHSPHSPHR